MSRRNKRLAYAAVLTGMIIVVLLLLTINRDPLARGFKPYQGRLDPRALCPWCEADGSLGLTDIVGLVLIGLVMLILPAGHIALLIMLAAQASKPPRFSDIEPAFRCPLCSHPLVRPWRVCPYCGHPINASESHPTSGASHYENGS